ncbi:MAG TPA: electron transport complex subunit E [Bacillota bacterium]|nr:electron transport complex subunit E [Bacillota bacterium]HUM56331.1 electron transport complex subunit E [Bacillota bacterium]
MKDKLSIFTKGIIKENPVLVLLLGMCPTLAVTTSAINGLGMGVSVIVVLTCSNIVISLLKKAIPGKVRVPGYIVVIAGFVTVVQLLLKAYLPELDESLGLFIPLIVVNCIILGRAEMFASKNTIIDSMLDGLGMGLGFTMALFLIGLIREFFGAGTAFGIELMADITPMGIFMLAPGGFFVLAMIIAAINWLSKGRAIKKKEIGCDGCPMISTCSGICEKEEAGV